MRESEWWAKGSVQKLRWISSRAIQLDFENIWANIARYLKYLGSDQAQISRDMGVWNFDTELDYEGKLN